MENSAATTAAAAAHRDLFISALIVTAQNGFGHDVDPYLALCRERIGVRVRVSVRVRIHPLSCPTLWQRLKVPGWQSVQVVTVVVRNAWGQIGALVGGNAQVLECGNG
jgi:hypothetical protein